MNSPDATPEDYIYAMVSIRYDMSRDVFQACLADKLEALAVTVMDQFDDLHRDPE
jgi:hypothetical protein